MVWIYWFHIFKVTFSITNKETCSIIFSNSVNYWDSTTTKTKKTHKGQHSVTHLCTYQPVNPSVLAYASMTADAAPPHSLSSSPFKTNRGHVSRSLYCYSSNHVIEITVLSGFWSYVYKFSVWVRLIFSAMSSWAQGLHTKSWVCLTNPTITFLTAKTSK